jgi:hypothetical protein
MIFIELAASEPDKSVEQLSIEQKEKKGIPLE